MAAETQRVTLPYQWTPRPYQQPLWDYLRSGGQHAVVCAHRRWGKDDVCLHHTACAMFERVGNYGHMLPEYAQGRKAIWDAVRPFKPGDPMSGKRRIDVAFPPFLRRRTDDQEMKLEMKNGSTWQVLGSDRYNALMGTSYAGIVKSEEALSHPGAIGYLSPIMRENQGWMLHISTARGHNHFERLLQTAMKTPGWYGETATVETTDVFTPAELAEELRILQDLHGEAYGLSIFQQEYYCSFDAAVPGAIWADCVDRATVTGRITDFAMHPQAHVSTGWDLGRTDDTAIWFYQFNGTGIDVFDHWAGPGMDVSNEDEPHKGLVQKLLALQAHYGLTYATHWLPHDARPRTQAAGGKSILSQFLDAAKKYPQLGHFAIAKKLDCQEGIQAARATFPRCRFHKTACAKGLNSLRHYHREWDEESRTYGTEPLHDWSSHDADAFRTMAVSWKKQDERQPESPLVDRLLAQSSDRQRWGTIVAAHLQKHRLAKLERQA